MWPTPKEKHGEPPKCLATHCGKTPVLPEKTCTQKKPAGVCFAAQKVLGRLNQEQAPPKLDPDARQIKLAQANALWELAYAQGADSETLRMLKRKVDDFEEDQPETEQINFKTLSDIDEALSKQDAFWETKEKKLETHASTLSAAFEKARSALQAHVDHMKDSQKNMLRQKQF